MSEEISPDDPRLLAITAEDIIGVLREMFPKELDIATREVALRQYQEKLVAMQAEIESLKSTPSAEPGEDVPPQ